MDLEQELDVAQSYVYTVHKGEGVRIIGCMLLSTTWITSDMKYDGNPEAGERFPSFLSY